MLAVQYLPMLYMLCCAVFSTQLRYAFDDEVPLMAMNPEPNVN